MSDKDRTCGRRGESRAMSTSRITSHGKWYRERDLCPPPHPQRSPPSGGRGQLQELVLVWDLIYCVPWHHFRRGLSPPAPGFAKAFIQPSAQSSFSGGSRAIYRTGKSRHLKRAGSWTHLLASDPSSALRGRAGGWGSRCGSPGKGVKAPVG